MGPASTAKFKPTKVLVRKEGSWWYGDLMWSDGTAWINWQSGFRTLRALTASTRCTFDGPIIRV